MRNFRNVPLSRQKSLAEAFPELLSLYDFIEVADYKKVSISVFDHWLSQDEAIKNIDNVSTIQAAKNNDLLHKFTISLTQSTEAYLVKFRGRNSDKKVIFKEFTSQKALVNILTPEYHFSGDRYRFILVLPQLNIVYFEGSDFTHQVYYKREKDMEFVSVLAKESGLSIIK